MRLFQKIMLILSLSLCLAGIATCAAAFAVSGFEIQNLTPEDQKMLKKSYETEISDIGSIDILTQNRPIELIPCKSDKLKITYAVRKRNQVLPEFTKTDNGDGKKAFQMEYRDQEELWQLVRFTFLPFYQDETIRIYLPDSYLDSIHLSTTNSRVTTDGLHINGKLEIVSTNGGISLINSSFSSLNTKTTNASIKLENCSAVENIAASTTNSSVKANKLQAGELSMTTSNGSITATACTAVNLHTVTTHASIKLENCTITGASSAKTSDAKITIDSIKAESLELVSSNGSLVLEQAKLNKVLKAKTTNGSIQCRNIAAETADIQTTNSSVSLETAAITSELSTFSKNGSIKVSQITGELITLQTTNASITGTVHGDISDYNIITDTTNGTSKLPSQFHETATKKLVIKTTNSKIDVKFE